MNFVQIGLRQRITFMCWCPRMGRDWFCMQLLYDPVYIRVPVVEDSKISPWKKLDDGGPESVEEQGLLLLVWRHHITKQYVKDVLYAVEKRSIKTIYSISTRQ